MVGAILYSAWAILIALWWISADPESAPQQAALAAQALVLVVIPYTILSAVQRAKAGQVASGRTERPQIEVAE